MSNNQVNTSQHFVIKNLNNYLKYHNLPIKLSEGGVCHGLSNLYISYVLNGKEEEFEDILSYIAQKNPPRNELYDNQLFVWVEKIINLQACDRQITRNQFTQSNSHEYMHVKYKYLQSIFKIGLNTSHENWAEIIKDINLTGNEVMRVSSLEHSVAISRDKNGYKVYDPNNTIVSQKFQTEEKMTEWLSKKAFNFSLSSSGRKRLGMSIDVISTEKREFPNLKQDLLNKYIKPSENTGSDQEGGDALYFAIATDDVETVEHILKEKAFNLDARLVVLAISNDSNNVLKILMDKGDNEGEKELNKKLLTDALYFAIKIGRYRCTETLLSNKTIDDVFNREIDSQKFSDLLKKAFEGMNSEIITLILDKKIECIGSQEKTLSISKKFLSQLINISIDKKNNEAIDLLADRIKDFDKSFNDEQDPAKSHTARLEFLKNAIAHNDPLMVRKLINRLKITPDELNCLKIGVSMVNKYNIEIFTTLKEKGFQFSPLTDDLIKSKQKQSIGIIKSIGIALMRFSEFITLQNKIKVDNDKINTLSIFKETVQSIRNANEENRAEVRPGS
ncbi:YopT-type cysteine protease domain-containing protein [Legionella norrlandica]|uniref:YopT-type cysteine protease domain-containing protein n=1 Tax=Legionella norrlandica TaxID=1498499 RepID=UPI000A5EA849|nr:YopT-type cysteine protease domain-containing protein [Legionella norrlandica]